MAYQPYDPCPCGSGKKIKFCCQKVVKYAEKASQLLEREQVAAALQAIDEGLAVDRDNLWLRIMKLEVLLATHDHDAADVLIQAILDSHPGHFPVLQLRLQHELAHHDVEAAVTTMQEILDSSAKRDAQVIVSMAVCARLLALSGSGFAALAHLHVANRAGSIDNPALAEIETLEGDTNHAVWLRDAWPLRPPPAGSNGAAERWNNAIALAGMGRWRRAIDLFESISADGAAAANRWFNIAICRASLGEDEAAAHALEQYIELEPDGDSAVQAMALAQALYPRESAENVEVVHIRHRIRDHSRLIQRLRDHRRFFPRVLDAQEGQAEQGVKDEFYVCSKEWKAIDESTTLHDLPLVDGLVRTRHGAVELEFAEPVQDDERPRLLLEAAGDTIDPEGERSVPGKMPLSTYRLRRGWVTPGALTPNLNLRIRHAMHEQLFRVIWPDTPHGWLDDRTPREAAGMPQYRLRLRAAVLLNENAAESLHAEIDEAAIRAELGLDCESEISGDAVDIERLPLARLRQVRTDGLSTTQLDTLFERAVRFSLQRAMRQAAEALAARNIEGSNTPPDLVFGTLADDRRSAGDRPGAAAWIDRARRFQSNAGTPPAFIWDLMDWKTSFAFDGPEVWVPAVQHLMTKYASDKDASRTLTLLLVEYGLIRLTPHPSDQRKMIADARILEALMARYASRQPGAVDLTPVGGQPGKLWTPDSERRGSGSPIVLPGESAPARGSSKLVIPGS